MNKFQNTVQRILYWTIPAGIYTLLRDKYDSSSENLLSKEEKGILQNNLDLKNVHQGQRCYILATGPSIKKQDLSSLKNEWCFGVSDFYKHPDYRLIKPAYYFIAPMHAPFSAEDGIKRLNELSECTHQDEAYFFTIDDRDILANSTLASQAPRVYWLKFSKMNQSPAEINLTRVLPKPMSVSIMALYGAIYMGFSEIYLLGCDHDRVWKWDGASSENRLEHFYEGKPSIGYEPFDVDNALQAHLRVRQQYKWINEIAHNQQIKIFNASPSSYIDIFPRVQFESVI